MELVYLPDSLPNFPNNWQTYPSWEENNFDRYGLRKQQTPPVKEIETSEKTCSICQQKKKRFLSDYIKNKQTHSSKIQEEEEEEEEEEEKQKPCSSAEQKKTNDK